MNAKFELVATEEASIFEGDDFIIDGLLGGLENMVGCP